MHWNKNACLCVFVKRCQQYVCLKLQTHDALTFSLMVWLLLLVLTFPLFLVVSLPLLMFTKLVCEWEACGLLIYWATTPTFSNYWLCWLRLIEVGVRGHSFPAPDATKQWITMCMNDGIYENSQQGMVVASQGLDPGQLLVNSITSKKRQL